MQARRVTAALGLLLLFAAAAYAQPSVAVNGVMAPTPVTVSAGRIITVTVSDGPANPTDWIALYPAGASDAAYVSWQYLTGTTSPPEAGLASASLTFLLPVVPGNYELRFFANDAFSRLAVSTVVTVSASQARLMINGAPPGTAVVADAGTEAGLTISGGPANRTDWVALYPVGTQDSAYVFWQYLSGMAAPPPTGLSDVSLAFDVPVVPGDYEFRFFANGGYARLATSGVLSVLPSQAQIAVNGVASPTGVVIPAGSEAVVAISDAPGNRTDWLALYPAGAGDTSYISWWYLTGTNAPPAVGLSAATLHLAMPTVAGAYEVRLFADNSDRRLATSGPITIGQTGAMIVVDGVVAPAEVTRVAGGRVTAAVSGGPANVGDWIGLYAVGSGDTAALAWRYLSGTTTPPASGSATASLAFDLPVSAGAYEFRLFANNSYSRLTTSARVIVSASQAQIAVNGAPPATPVTVNAGSRTSVAVSGGPGNATDWVALYAVGAPDSSFLSWRYLSGTTAPPTSGLSDATFQVPMPTVPGTYELRFFASNGYGRLATSAAITIAPTAARIAVNGQVPPGSVSVGLGQSVSVHVTNAPGNATDWVALAPVHAPDTTQIAWQYLSGTTAPPASGITDATLTFTMPASAGEYELRLFMSDGFDLLSRSSTVVVQAAPPTCAYALSRSTLSTSSTARSDGFALTTDPTCAWTVAHPNWVAVTRTSGSGSGVIGFTVEANTTGVSRQGTVAVGGQTLTINQASEPCEGTLSPASVDIPQAGGAGTLVGHTLWGCATPVTSNRSWVRVPRAGYPNAVVADAPSAYWRLGDAGSTTATDASGHGLDAVLAGTFVQGVPASFADGDPATAFAGDGYANAGYRSELDPSYGSFSLEAWIRFTESTAGTVAGAASDGYGYQLQLTGRRARFRADSFDPVFALDSASDLDDGTWHHLVGVFDAASGEARLFVDGVLDASAAAMGAVASGGDFLIGARNFASDGFISAAIDEVAYFPRALTAEQVARHFQNQHGPLANTGALEDVIEYVVQANPTGVARTGSISFGSQATTVNQPGLPCSVTVGQAAVAAPEQGGPGFLSLTGIPGCGWSASADMPWITIGRLVDGYQGQVLADHPAAFWRLDDTGSTAVDASGNGYDAAYTGTYQQGVPGATLDGDRATRFENDGYAWFYRDTAPLVPEGPMTFEAWVQSRSQGGNLLGTWNYSLSAGSSGARFTATYGEGQHAFDLQGTRPINDGEWHHLVATADPDAQVAQLFVDGTLDTVGPITGYLSPLYALAIGQGPAVIDEVAVYRSVLTDAQVRRHFDAQLASGGGTGQLEYLVAPNPDIQPRAGSLHVAGVQIPVTQAARHCIDITPTSVEMAASGGVGSVAVSAIAGPCGWAATSDVPWMTVEPAAGVGPGTVHFTIAVSESVIRRIGHLTIGGQAVTVTQAAAPLHRPEPGYSIAAGVHHTLALKSDGTVWSWGSDDSGQLGDGAATGRLTPGPVSTLSSVVAVAAGDHSMALKSDGTVWTWGSNRYGQLGAGAIAYALEPVAVVGLSDVVAIAAGRYHSVALKSDGTVWTWGRNVYGQLGDGTTTNRSVPTMVLGLPMPAVGIVATDFRTMVLEPDGSVWGFGYNAHGELGDGNPWQAVTWLTQAVGLPPTVAGLGGGAFHGFATTSEGRLWAWGGNDSGQLGDGTKTDRLQPVDLPGVANVTQVQGGAAHSVARLADGTVWTWGANNTGQLGNGTPPCGQSDYTACSARQAVAAPAAVAGPTDVVAVSANGAATFAVASDGRVWSWGANDARNLGDGTTDARPSPVQIAEPGLTWRTGTPTLQAGGTYFDELQVHGGSTTAGSVLRYTTNGQDPSEGDPVFPVGGIYITETTTVKLRAWAAGQPPSNVATATYILKVKTPTLSPTPAVFTTPQAVTVTSPTAGASLFYTIDGTTPEPGALTTAAYSGAVAIATRTQLIAIGRRPGWADSDPAIGDYQFNYGTLAPPMIAPPSGTYVYGEAITLSANPIAAIRYTTDGSTPTATSAAYAGPLALTVPLTVTAVAFHSDWTASQPASATFGVKAAAPAFSPGAGSYAEGSRVTITTATPGATTHYTTNGQEPGLLDPIVSNGGSVAVGNYTLRARAFRAGLIASDVTAAVYSRDGDPCRLSVNPPVVTTGSGPSGGVLSVISTGGGCSWSARTDAPWISLDAASGSGSSGQVAYHIAPNPDASLRVALITVADVDVVVVQRGAGACTPGVSPASVAAASSATTGALDITFADPGCAWSASSDVPWLTFSAATDVSAYAQAVAADQPVGYWPLADPAGSVTVADASGFAHPGTATTGVTFGQPGARADGRTAATFDGASGAVVLPASAAPDSGSFTWEAWVKVPAVANARRDILSRGGGAGVFSLGIDANASQATFELLPAAGSRQSITLAPTVVGMGWVHLAFTADGSAWHAYVNGAAVDSGVLEGGLASSADPVVLGRDGAAPQGWYDGALADVAVYPYAFSADQIAHHWALREMTGAGGATLVYAVETNASGAVRTGTLTVAGVAVPVSQAAVGGVSIVGGVSPSPNAAGWSRTAVTVSFSCAGDGTVTCPAPVTVTQDGEQDVQGVASNDLGATATASVHVRLDQTAPLILIASPVRGELVVAGPITVRGTVADALSGLQGVSCNGVAATVDETGFTCQVVVPAGTTTVEVVATDLASNVRRATIEVATVEEATTRPPLGLRVSPATATLVMGASRGFSVKDTYGRVLPGVTWSVDVEGIASLEPAGGAVKVTGVTAGVVHVTAAWQGLTAQAELTVLAEIASDPGAVTLWSAPPVGGSVRRIVQGATLADGTHRIYTYEGTDEKLDHDTIRAFEADGREAWSAPAGGKVVQLSGDPSGGLVALVSDRDGAGSGLRVFGPTGSGGGLIQGVSRFAIHPNGPLYYVDATSTLVALDIGLGGGPGAAIAGVAGQPTVLLDGSVVVPSVLDSENLQLTFVRPTGAVETQAVNVPNGSLFYPYRAVPNGQGGLLVQLRRRLWPGTETEVWDAVVVGVDAAGTLTGQTPLADDWGEIVVGEHGNILVTSLVEYWTDPGYASVPKYHVGFLQQITPEGNPAAIGESYPPSGPCGWQWDGLSQSWYYNGDCDQEVLSITSIAARGADTFVTMNDGTVFAPGPLGQLHLSYLVPAADGTYLGVGAAGATMARGASGAGDAGALMGIAVPWEEPASPFGPPCPVDGGGTDNAHAANPPSALRLLGEDENRRSADLALLKDALDRDRHGMRRGGASALLSSDSDGYVRVLGSISSFKSYGDIAKKMGDLMERLGQQTVTLGLGRTAESLGTWGGGRTLERGEIAARAPGRRECRWPCVLINPIDLENNELFRGNAYQAFYEGQDRAPFWAVPSFRGEGASVALWHEFGHVWGALHGRGVRDHASDAEAVQWENRMRISMYGPCGSQNAMRYRHSGLLGAILEAERCANRIPSDRQ